MTNETMGTWNTKINGNDTFQDIYKNFFDLYNQGQNPAEISKKIQDEFSEMFEDYEDRNNSLFGLVLAQWETKSLDSLVYCQVKEIIEKEKDIEIWKELGANEKTLKQRKIVLNKFFIQISTHRQKAKRRTKPKFEFEVINLINEIAPDGLKKFDVNEEYTNKKYIHTSGIIMWEEGGGSVLYFTGKGKNISVKWIDIKSIEIIHDKDIEFTMKKNNIRYRGDNINVVYKQN